MTAAGFTPEILEALSKLPMWRQRRHENSLRAWMGMELLPVIPEPPQLRLVVCAPRESKEQATS